MLHRVKRGTKVQQEETYYKQLLDEVFVIFGINQGRGKCYQPKPKAEADNTNRGLYYSGYHKNRI